QPPAGADRRVRAGEPESVQPGGWRRLRFRGRYRPGARPEESAGGGPPARRVQELARAGTGTTRTRGGCVTPRGGARGAVAGRERHRHALPRRIAALRRDAREPPGCPRLAVLAAPLMHSADRSPDSILWGCRKLLQRDHAACVLALDK